MLKISNFIPPNETQPTDDNLSSTAPSTPIIIPPNETLPTDDALLPTTPSTVFIPPNELTLRSEFASITVSLPYERRVSTLPELLKSVDRGLNHFINTDCRYSSCLDGEKVTATEIPTLLANGATTIYVSKIRVPNTTTVMDEDHQISTEYYDFYGRKMGEMDKEKVANHVAMINKLYIERAKERAERKNKAAPQT